jgi:hypothetical protein
VLQVHDVLEHKPAAAPQAMPKCEPHLHAVILAIAIGLITFFKTVESAPLNTEKRRFCGPSLEPSWNQNA